MFDKHSIELLFCNAVNILIDYQTLRRVTERYEQKRTHASGTRHPQFRVRFSILLMDFDFDSDSVDAKLGNNVMDGAL